MKNEDPQPDESLSPARGYLRFFPLWPGESREAIKRNVEAHLDAFGFDGTETVSRRDEPPGDTARKPPY